MDMEQVKALFTLFSGEEDTTTYQPVIYAAMTEVRQMLREGASETDARLGYLAAAIANLRYTEIFGAREKALATYAGTIARQSDAAQQLRFAKQLVYSYQGLCKSLVVGTGFQFQLIPEAYYAAVI